MKKFLFFLYILTCLLPSTVKAAEILDATPISAYQKDGLNVVNFSIHIDIAKDYFAQFWLLPARHADNSFTSYQVSVNGKKVGDIVPSEGNWQSIGIKGNPALSLKEGPNTISIATRAPELPQIEDVKVVSTRSIQAFSTREYKAFCDKAKKRSQYKVQQPFYINSTVPRDVKDVHIEGTEIGEVDLVYSFFQISLLSKASRYLSLPQVRPNMTSTWFITAAKIFL